MTLPNIGNSRQEQFGVGTIMQIVSKSQTDGGLGFIFRHQRDADVGIDGHIEVINPQSGEATGRFVGVQVKAGTSFFSHPYDGGWTVYIQKPTVHYWRRYAVPVILTVVDIPNGNTYWALVSTGDFEETTESYKIPIPATQCFNSSAAETIVAIAASAPSLAARFILPDVLAQEQNTVNSSYARAQNSHEYSTAAEEGWLLSQKLLACDFPYEAARAGQYAIRALVRGGEKTKAAEWLIVVLKRTVYELRDGAMAQSILAMCRASERPEDRHSWTDSLPKGIQLQLDVLEAEAEAITGFNQKAKTFLSRLSAYTTRATEQSMPALLSATARLNTLVALTEEDHNIARQSYTERANLVNNETEEDPEPAPRLQTRALLHMGLSSDSSAVSETIQRLSVPDHALADRAFVAGWLQTAAGQYREASQSFHNAAGRALERDDLYTALRAFRNAEQANIRAGIIELDDHNPGKRAANLVPLVEVTVKRHTTHERLMRRVANALDGDRLPEAYVAAQTARVLAWQDADLAAHEEAIVRLAAIWRAAAIEDPREDVLLTAIRDTARTYALVDSGAIDAFVTAVKDHMVGDFPEKLWETLTDDLDSPQDIVGALGLATRFASQWQLAERDIQSTSLLLRGLELGWTGPTRLKGVPTALKLILALDPPISGASAAEIRDALIPLLESAPIADMDDVLNAIAVTLVSASPPSDEGTMLMDAILSQEQRATAAHAQWQWSGALAMLTSRAVGDSRLRLMSEITTRIQLNDGSVINWHQAERALAAGIDISDDIADKYLNRQADVIDTLRTQAGSGTYSGGASDIDAMTMWAATRATNTVRQRALAAAIDFLLTQDHLLTARTVWIPFIARLAQTTPELLSPAINALQVVAEGALTWLEGFDEFTHPLSGGFRVTGHSLRELRAFAISWLATLLPIATGTDAKKILTQLYGATRDASPEIRLSAAHGAQWNLQNILEVPTNETSPNPRRAICSILESLTNDPVDRIALFALRAIRAESLNRSKTPQ